MVTDRNNKEIKIGDLVKYVDRKSKKVTTARVRAFCQGGDEQYIKLSDGSLKGDWMVEKVEEV